MRLQHVGCAKRIVREFRIGKDGETRSWPDHGGTAQLGTLAFLDNFIAPKVEAAVFDEQGPTIRLE